MRRRRSRRPECMTRCSSNLGPGWTPRSRGRIPWLLPRFGAGGRQRLVNVLPLVPFRKRSFHGKCEGIGFAMDTPERAPCRNHFDPDSDLDPNGELTGIAPNALPIRPGPHSLVRLFEDAARNSGCRQTVPGAQGASGTKARPVSGCCAIRRPSSLTRCRRRIGRGGSPIEPGEGR